MPQPNTNTRHSFVYFLAAYAVIGCVVFAASIFVADQMVPNHDWIADTISDLAAGELEFIVDAGLYVFSSSLTAIALLAAHVHLGDRWWSVGILGFALFGLIVFLIGARDEYGDGDNEGFVIHYYLVYAIGALMTGLPLMMMSGAARVHARYRSAFVAISTVWTISAPVFFIMSDDLDGVYERYLGCISIVFVCLMADMFVRWCRLRNAT